MTTPPSPFSRGAFSPYILVVVVGLCLLALGATGYVRLQADRQAALLAAPDEAFTPEQELYEKTILALGYGGFLGAAQNLATLREASALSDMRMSLKTAQEATERATNKAPASVRKDVRAIMGLFAALMTKAESGAVPGEALSNTDFLTAASALSTLDLRLQAATAAARTDAHRALGSWNTLLALMAWGGLILAAAFGAGAYYAFTTRQSAPLQKLVQCLENIANGDGHSPVWGTERLDALGDLARAIDKARATFTQIPDIAVETDEGPLYMTFRGEKRDLFQSLMKAVSEHSASLMKNSEALALKAQAQDAQFEGITQNIRETLTTLQTCGTALFEASETLLDAQERHQERLASLTPAMEERARAMAEVTQLAGTQIAQSLQSLVKAETSLRASAQQHQKTAGQLELTTGQMGERMVAALNLVQAGGKVMGDMAATVKGRIEDAVSTLTRGEGKLRDIVARAETRLEETVNAEENMAALAARTETSAQKMERAVAAIYDRHEGLNEHIITATHRMESIVVSFDAAHRSMDDATAQIRRDGSLLANLLAELRANNDQLISSLNQNSQTNFAAAQNLSEKSHALMQRLEVQIQQQAKAADAHVAALAVHGQTMAEQTAGTTATLAQTIASMKVEQDRLAGARAKFTDMIDDLGLRFEKQATATFGKTESWAAQNFATLNTIAEQVDAVMQRLGMLGQLTGTLGAVAGQLGQLLPALSQTPGLAGGPHKTREDDEAVKALLTAQTEGILNELQGQWHQAVVQIEAMHDQLAQIVVQQKDQLETRLIVMDRKLRLATKDAQGESLNDGTTTAEAEGALVAVLNALGGPTETEALAEENAPDDSAFARS